MEAEVYADIPTTMRYYGTEMTEESDFPMNFLLITSDPASEWNADSMRSKILEWMRNMPSGKWPNWVVRDTLYQTCATHCSILMRSIKAFEKNKYNCGF